MNTKPHNPHHAVSERSAAGTAAGRVYSGLQPSQRAQERYEKFIDAGIEVFGTVGYAASKIKTLCQSAGLSERYFYESFESREHLLTCVYERVSANLMQQVTAALQNPEVEAPDAIRDSLAAVVNYMLGDPRHAQIILVEIVGISDELEAKRHLAMTNFAGQSMGALLIMGGIESRVVKQVLGGGLGGQGRGFAHRVGARLVDPSHPLAEALEFARLTAISMVGGVNNMLLDAVLGGTTSNVEKILEVSYQLMWNASSGVRTLAGATAVDEAQVTPAT